MGDEIPNEYYSKVCPNEKCGHHNLEFRNFCYMCATWLGDKRDDPTRETEEAR